MKNEDLTLEQRGTACVKDGDLTNSEGQQV